MRDGPAHLPFHASVSRSAPFSPDVARRSPIAPTSISRASAWSYRLPIRDQLSFTAGFTLCAIARNTLEPLGDREITKFQRLKPLRAEERRWPVAWVRLWRRDMRDTAGIISDRTKLVSSRRPTSFGAPKTFDERRQERKIRCAVVLRTLERSGHARLSAHLHILLASYILIIMIRLTYLSRAFCSRTITPHLK